MRMVTEHRLFDPEVVEEITGVAGVLRDDDVNGSQHLDRPQGDVLQVANRSRNDVERTHGFEDPFPPLMRRTMAIIDETHPTGSRAPVNEHPAHGQTHAF